MSRIVDGRSTCEVGASEIVMGPVRLGRLMSITAFAVEAIAGSRTVDGPGMSERLSLRPWNPSGLQVGAVIGRHDDEAAVVDAERAGAVEQRARRAGWRTVIARCSFPATSRSRR